MLRLWMSLDGCVSAARVFSRREGVETLAYKRILANGVIDYFWKVGAGDPDVPPDAAWELLARFLDGESVREAFVARLLESSTEEQMGWFTALDQRRREELGNLIRSEGPFNGDLIGDWVGDRSAPRDWHLQIVYERRLKESSR
jgi:hypothetical protein